MKTLSKPLCLVAAGMLLIAAGCTTNPAGKPAAPRFEQAYAPIDAAAQVAAMKRGVNVLGYDPVWRDPSEARFTPPMFRKIHDAGFSTVRVVLQSFAHMDDDNRLDPRWIATLDTMVKAALEAHLNVILDEHDYGVCGKDAAACSVKVMAFWSQIAPRYKDAPNNVMFEILNEPNSAVTPQAWDALWHEALALIRTTNPTRNVIIGPSFWNSMDHLADINDLPTDDQHIIVTFHDYNPMRFTHQGATWVGPEIMKLSGVPWGTEADSALLNKQLDTVKAWSEAHHRPIFMGEFGAFDKAPMESRVKWDSAMARGAEARGFAWAYWQLDPDFVLYDFSTQSWVEPVLHALVPPAEAAVSK